MNEAVAARVVRARELLVIVRNAAMATVNDDGSPHNTPYFFMASDDLKNLYWVSHLESRHSHNILRDGRLFVVLFDTVGKGGGLYIEAHDGHILEGVELDEGLTVSNPAMAKIGRNHLKPDFYSGRDLERLWRADASRFWINISEHDSEGSVLVDYRREIKREDLLA